MIGALTDIYIPPSRFLVYPHVGLLSARPDFRPDPREVAEIIEVDVFQFLDPSRRAIHKVNVSAGFEISAPGYTINDGELIWGGTAMMLAELAYLLEEWQKLG